MEIGDIIKGYTIKEYIGDGGMGIVFKVEKDGKEYALKICTQQMMSMSQDLRERYE